MRSPTLLSVSYEESGQEGLALAEMEKATKLNPNDAVAQYNYGTRALASDYTKEAVDSLTKAVSLDGSNAQYRKALGSALIRQGTRDPRQRQDRGLRQGCQSNGKELVKLNGSYDNYLHLAEAELGAKQYQCCRDRSRPGDWQAGVEGMAPVLLQEPGPHLAHEVHRRDRTSRGCSHEAPGRSEEDLQPAPASSTRR